MNRRAAPLLILAGLAAGCRKADAPPAPPAFDPVALEARFPADLGSGLLDVSSYPPEKQSTFALFSQKCSACHGLARPLNSPWTAEVDWRRYVERMETNNLDKNGKPLLTPVEAKKIISFLVYDSRERKVKNRAAFEAEQARLNDLFAKVTAEKNRLAAAQSKSRSRESAPYVGDR